MTNTPPSGPVSGHPEIRITQYADWMAPQVIALLSREWGLALDAETRWFHQWFDHPVQRQAAVRLVALDGETVCGFQSYAYWPYEWAGKTLHTLQSGGSVVSPDYRGQGIFARLLGFPLSPEVSFVTGFPAPASFGSAIRNGWVSPLSLDWHVRALHPLSVIGKVEPWRVVSPFQTEPEAIDPFRPARVFSLSTDPGFLAWRAACSPEPYWYFHFRDRGRTIRYQLKPNRRGRVSELIIGDVARESPDLTLLTASLRALIRAAKSETSFTMLSVAINDRCRDASLRTSFMACRFHSIRRQIPFCVKTLASEAATTKAENWWLLRSDIDTW